MCCGEVAGTEVTDIRDCYIVLKGTSSYWQKWQKNRPVVQLEQPTGRPVYIPSAPPPRPPPLSFQNGLNINDDLLSDSNHQIMKRSHCHNNTIYRNNTLTPETFETLVFFKPFLAAYSHGKQAGSVGPETYAAVVVSLVGLVSSIHSDIIVMVDWVLETEFLPSFLASSRPWTVKGILPTGDATFVHIYS